MLKVKRGCQRQRNARVSDKRLYWENIFGLEWSPSGTVNVLADFEPSLSLSLSRLFSRLRMNHEQQRTAIHTRHASSSINSQSTGLCPLSKKAEGYHYDLQQAPHANICKTRSSIKTVSVCLTSLILLANPVASIQLSHICMSSRRKLEAAISLHTRKYLRTNLIQCKVVRINPTTAS